MSRSVVQESGAEIAQRSRAGEFRGKASNGRSRGGLVAARIAASALALVSASSALAQTNFSLFVGTREEIADRMIRMARLEPGNVVVDLGSGDGRLVNWSAKANPGVSGFGVDINPALVREATARAWMEGVGDRVRFHHQNVFDADLSKADVIYMWLFPELMRLLRNKILAEARPGTRIVSQMFSMDPWPADEVDTSVSPVYRWVVPARIAGTWNWDLPPLRNPQIGTTRAAGGRAESRLGRIHYSAIFEQSFQRGDAVVRVENARRVAREVKIDGTKLSFTLTIPRPDTAEPKEQEFSGTVKGDVIEGRVRVYGPFRSEEEKRVYEDQPWRATRGGKTRYFDYTGTGPIR